MGCLIIGQNKENIRWFTDAKCNKGKGKQGTYFHHQMTRTVTSNGQADEDLIQIKIEKQLSGSLIKNYRFILINKHTIL